ncbi:MAG TPA: GFA family protein [Candidatus Binatia bacterium]|nr:GFA family protein [Candidatus Binatia bacterium]
MADTPVSGSCFCGAVRFEILPPTLFCGHCHCGMCRKAHAAPFVTWFGVPYAQLRVTAGEDRLVRRKSSDHGRRTFCRECGSQLFCESTNHPDYIDITLASMEAPIDRKPEAHWYVDDRAPWTVLDDGLPRFGGPTGQEPR